MKSLKEHAAFNTLRKAHDNHELGAQVAFPHEGKLKTGKVVHYNANDAHYMIDHGDLHPARVAAHIVKKHDAFMSLTEEEGSHIPGQSKWTPAVKTRLHYQGQINGKTFVVPHSFLNIYKKGGYPDPMRHNIVTSLHHVQHNNKDLTPEEVTRVHQHIKDLHSGQEPSKLEEESYFYHMGGAHSGQYVTAKSEADAHKKVEKRHGSKAVTLKLAVPSASKEDQLKESVLGVKQKRLTPEQKKAKENYKFANQQLDRYMGSVFVNSHGQRQHEEKVKQAHDECKRLGIEEEYQYPDPGPDEAEARAHEYFARLARTPAAKAKKNKEDAKEFAKSHVKDFIYRQNRKG